MRLYPVLIVFITCLINSSFGQRSFFVDPKIYTKCELKYFFFDDDSLLLTPTIYWEVGDDSVNMNQHYYYPYIFSDYQFNDTIGYLRCLDDKIMIVAKDDSLKIEQLMFDFKDKKSNIKLNGVNGFGGCIISYKRKYYSFKYKENIYVYSFLYDYYIGITYFKEIHIGVRSGLTKAIFENVEHRICMECIKTNNPASRSMSK